MKMFLMNHIGVSCMIGFGIVGTILQMLISISLNSYVKASGNMKTTTKKNLMNLKNQYEAMCGMDHQIKNVGVYVDKYLVKLRIMGISYQYLDKAIWVVFGMMTLTGLGVGLFHWQTHLLEEQLMEIETTYGIILVLFFIGHHIFGIKNKKAQIRIQLVDYLENYLSFRFEKKEDNDNEDVELLRSMLKDMMEREEENQTEGLEKVDQISPKQQEKTLDLPEEKMSVKEKEALETEDAVGTDALGEIAAEVELGDSNMDLLEEFVQAFLAQSGEA